MSGDRQTAEAFCAMAHGIAAEYRDADVIGYVLVVRSFMCSRLFDTSIGPASASLTLLNQAVDVARRTSSHHLKAFALNRRAEEHALQGTRSGARAAYRDLERAEAALAGMDHPHLGYFHYLDGVRLAGTRGSCAALLSDARTAISILSDVLTATSPRLVSERSILFTDLGAAYAQVREPEQACALLVRSLALGSDGDANRIQRVARVRRWFLREWAALSAVRDLDEQLLAQLHDDVP
jgi:hypothetical protein